jgi:hypothetical protein
VFIVELPRNSSNASPISSSMTEASARPSPIRSAVCWRPRSSTATNAAGVGEQGEGPGVGVGGSVAGEGCDGSDRVLVVHRSTRCGKVDPGANPCHDEPMRADER